MDWKPPLPRECQNFLSAALCRDFFAFFFYKVLSFFFRSPRPRHCLDGRCPPVTLPPSWTRGGVRPSHLLLAKPGNPPPIEPWVCCKCVVQIKAHRRRRRQSSVPILMAILKKSTKNHAGPNGSAPPATRQMSAIAHLCFY